MLHLDDNSTIFIYITGHGGDGFIKILDRDFLHKNDLMAALIYLSKRLKRVVIILDTCQAETNVDPLNLPINCFVICSSKKGQPSVSYKSNCEIGCAVVDSLPKVFYESYKSFKKPDFYIEDFLNTFTLEKLGSNVLFFGKKNYLKLEDFLVNSKDEKLCKFNL
ncbi:glycosylphosphatidylinositol anchor biosynthesis [Gurleya vavrai]